MTAAWTVSLPASDKLVLLALADCANDEGRCWPGLATLCEKTGKCRRSLQESLRALDAAGHITREENPGKGMNYTVHPVAKSAPVARTAPVAKSAAGGGKDCYRGVAKSAPKPSVNLKEPSPSKRAIPDDWWPQEFAEGTESRKVVDGWPPGELAAQVEQFRAHHGSKNNTFSDPQKAWSTWVLNTRKWGIGKHERGDPTFDALKRFQSICDDVGASAGTGEKPEAGSAGVDGLRRPTGVDRLGS
jgi:hypothetical protein